MFNNLDNDNIFNPQDDIFNLNYNIFDDIEPAISPLLLASIHKPQIVETISNEPTQIPCFLEGTKIFTINGEINIEDLKISDYLITHDGRIIKMQQLVYFSTKIKDINTLPYKIPKNSKING